MNSSDFPHTPHIPSQHDAENSSVQKPSDAESASVHLFPGMDENTAAEETADQVRIEILEQELDRAKDSMIRALADAENTRKRALREREDATKYAISGFSRDILSVADNLRRALSAIPEELAETSPEIKTLISGIEATERELLKAFEKNGIQKIEPLDEMYNPHFHEVIFEAVIPNKPAGSIIQVVEAGYVLNGRVLRPARVGVAKSDTSGPVHSIDTQA